MKKLSLKGKIILGVIGGAILLLIIIIILNLIPKKNASGTPSDNQNQNNNVTEPEKPKLKIMDLDSKSRSYAVMINNHSQARAHHAGLQDAYLIYEIIVEGGLTRYMALFIVQETAKIGGIRSGRD